jgi:hypothetical protein
MARRSVSVARAIGRSLRCTTISATAWRARRSTRDACLTSPTGSAAAARCDRQLGEIGADPAKLGVDVGEETSLQQPVIGKIDPRDHVTGVKRHLLGLGEIVLRVAIEGQLSDAPNRDELFGNELGGVEEIEVELEFVLLLDNLQAQFPFGIVAALMASNRLRRLKSASLPASF